MHVFVIKNKRINMRISDKRYAKLQALSQIKEKSITAIFEDWIDGLSFPEIGNSSDIYHPQ